MYQLIETIKVINGQFQNLPYHNARLNNARRELFSCKDEIDIALLVSIPAEVKKGVYKCTVTYSEKILAAQFQPYIIRKINNLKLVVNNEIDYSYKYADRVNLNKLLEQKGECDEIIIVKNGLITDTSYTNLVFYDGAKWLTPNSPLLKGTKREKLLKEGLIEEVEIKANDLTKYSKVALINAMLELGNVEVDIKNLKF
jgi:4-amino-4-deoxychorismate lyase